MVEFSKFVAVAKFIRVALNNIFSLSETEDTFIVAQCFKRSLKFCTLWICFKLLLFLCNCMRHFLTLEGAFEALQIDVRATSLELASLTDPLQRIVKLTELAVIAENLTIEIDIAWLLSNRGLSIFNQ